MIVECSQCSTRFKLDDSKVKDEGVKVRCSKCKHVFVVRKEPSHDEAEFDSILSQFGPGSPLPSEPQIGESSVAAASSLAGQPDLSGEPSTGAGHPVVREDDDFFAGSRNFPADDTISNAGPSHDVDEDASAAIPPAAESSPQKDDFFDFETPATIQVGTAQEVQQEQHDEFSFTLDGPSETQSEKSGQEEWGGVAFGLGDQSDLPKPEPSPAETSAASPEDVVQSSEDSFSFSTLDSGETSPDVGTVPGEETPHVAPPHRAAVQDEEENWIGASVFDGGTTTSPQDEPAPIDEAVSPQRRRRGPSAPIMVIVAALLLVLVFAGAGFYLLNGGPSAFNRLGLGFMASWLGIETKDEGGIAILNSSASFVVNKEAGELFVIRGEAVNNHAKPRTSIQVKAVVYGAKGEAVLQKTVYCGNLLSNDQLTTLPMTKIEEAMNNQFGDSLANLGVQSGKAVPFVAVFSGVPKDATEFGVEVVGSTVVGK